MVKQLNKEAKQCLMDILSNMTVENKTTELIEFNHSGRNYCLRIKTNADGNPIAMDLLIPCGDLWMVKRD